MKQRRGVSIMLFKIDNSKCLFLENVEMVNCANILSPNDASIVDVRFKQCIIYLSENICINKISYSVEHGICSV